jgi:carbonic anhydrase
MELLKIMSESDIPDEFKETPIGDLLRYNNLGQEFKQYDNAQILLGMCMDNRKQLRIPENFAYILRTGGGNLRTSEFKISYAIGVGRVRYIALIGHNHCGMVNLVSKRDEFVAGLCEVANWTKERALQHFMNYAPFFEIENEIEFAVNESRRLGARYPGVHVVPLFYDVDDNRLYIIKSDDATISPDS